MATITICSDASFSNKYKVATWACYIRTPLKTVKRSGVFKTPIDSSSKAEKLGMINALHIADKLVDLNKYRLILYCDNLYALQKVKVKKTPKSKYYHKAIATNKFYDEHIQPFLDKSISFEIRHVKGHLPESEWDKNSKRNYMNNQCDIMAHELLRKETKKIREGLE